MGSSLRRIAAWLVFVSFAAIILWRGVTPALQNPRGDFANYYTAARLVAEGLPLENAYRDFVWFQKQIDRYGISHQLGGFIPHPPPTALVMLPLTIFEPLTAKRLWIALNVLLAVVCIVLFARISSLHWLPVAIIFLSTGFGLINNFLFGQMYLLLLASIAGGIYLQQRGQPVWAGVLLGIMIPMKYVGAFFVIFFLWKREWRLVIAAVLTSMAIVALTLMLQGAEIFRVFIGEVLPRHLQGEIQDPFAIQFQSWNSMLRRLFIANPSLNPQPPLPSEFLFVLCKSFIPWLWLAAFVWLYRQTAFAQASHQHLFEIGLLPLAILLVSPGSATYHFLLLSLTTVCLVKILVDEQQLQRALLLAGLFLVINLPHYLKLKKYAAGWLTPLGYARLWLLVFFFGVVLYLFHRPANWRWQPLRMARTYFAPAVTVALLLSAFNLHQVNGKERDVAEWVSLHEQEFDRHLGLLVKTPDLGKERLVFSYGELLDEDYAIFAMTHNGKIEGQWTPDTSQKFYEPDLAQDDVSLLMESINHGRAEIWLSRGQGEWPKFLLEGENPSWHFEEKRFAFIHAGRIGLAKVHEQVVSEAVFLNEVEGCYDLAFSPVDDRLLFCAEQKSEKRYALGVVNVSSGVQQIILESEGKCERPAWSPDASRIAFSWNQNGNRDLWIMELNTRKLQRLTRDPAIDTAPVWDEANQRLLFTSDRGRGLECSTMFEISSELGWKPR